MSVRKAGKQRRQIVKKRAAKRYIPRMSPTGAESVPISEAERRTGLSVRTLKRMIAAGQLEAFRSPGGHVRVSNAGLEKLLRGSASPTPVPRSSVLQNKQERVEELSLDLQEKRARRELRRFDEEDADVERRRTDAQRNQELADRRAATQRQLDRARAEEIRRREEREADASRESAEFRGRWILWTTQTIPRWFSPDQAQNVTSAVESALSTFQPSASDADVRRLLENTIDRISEPWEAERAERTRRDKLVEDAVRGLPWGATDVEKARTAADTRAALSRVPLKAPHWETAAAIGAALAPINAAIEERERAEKVRVQADRERKSREIQKSVLIGWALAEISSYLLELYSHNDISREAYYDGEWKRELEGAARKRADTEMTGTESYEDAKRIAREVVDEELGD
jgi:excisionase family DNA binding protein